MYNYFFLKINYGPVCTQIYFRRSWYLKYQVSITCGGLMRPNTNSLHYPKIYVSRFSSSCLVFLTLQNFPKKIWDRNVSRSSNFRTDQFNHWQRIPNSKILLPLIASTLVLPPPIDDKTGKMTLTKRFCISSYPRWLSNTLISVCVCFGKIAFISNETQRKPTSKVHMATLSLIYIHYRPFVQTAWFDVGYLTDLLIPLMGLTKQHQFINTLFLSQLMDSKSWYHTTYIPQNSNPSFYLQVSETLINWYSKCPLHSSWHFFGIIRGGFGVVVPLLTQYFHFHIISWKLAKQWVFTSLWGWRLTSEKAWISYRLYICCIRWWDMGWNSTKNNSTKSTKAAGCCTTKKKWLNWCCPWRQIWCCETNCPHQDYCYVVSQWLWTDCSHGKHEIFITNTQINSQIATNSGKIESTIFNLRCY